MHKINPGLFTQLMRLPDSIRADLLEFVGGTPVADVQLQQIIEGISARLASEHQGRPEPT